jgi:ATP-binding protein involved in chromosome partitioning
MLGLKGKRPEVIEKEGKHKIIPLEQYGVRALSIGLLVDDKQAIVWRGPMASSALRQFVTDVEWGDLDYLIIDLPPGTGDIHLTLVQTVPVTGAVIVTTPQEVAMADAKKAIAMFRMGQIQVPVLGVVENMAYFTPAELPDNKYYLFGEGGGQRLADEFELPLLGEIPLVQSIREGGDNGVPVSAQEQAISNEAFARMARNVAQQVSVRNANLAPTKPVEITT